MHRLSALGHARREDDRRARDARARDRVPHPRAQHREGAQPQGQGARGDPHGARDRRRTTTRSETDFAFELEQPVARHDRHLLREEPAVLGRRVQLGRHASARAFSTDPMSKSLKMREAHADKLLELDELVTEAVAKLKEAGWTSGYLKPIVVARINPLRFAKTGKDEQRRLRQDHRQDDRGREEVRRRRRSRRRTSRSPPRSAAATTNELEEVVVDAGAAGEPTSP